MSYSIFRKYFIILNFRTMKHIITFAAIIFSTFISHSSFAQKNTSSIKSDTIQVWGNCGSCKSRIEKAAKSVGAETASWDSETQMLVVTYDKAKASVEQIEKAIAKKGHDTETFSANESDYEKLPGCCQYERKGVAEESN
jgi:periplasmic mercuric ion binding protein